MPHKNPEEASEYHKAYMRRKYADPKYREKHKRLVADRKRRIAEWLIDLKRGLMCSRCATECHPAVVDFHHPDPSKKEVLGTGMGWSGWSKKRIQAEIAKCEIVCANCHRIIHWELRGRA